MFVCRAAKRAAAPEPLNSNSHTRHGFIFSTQVLLRRVLAPSRLPRKSISYANSYYFPVGRYN